MNTLSIFPIWFRAGVVTLIVVACGYAAANSRSTVPTAHNELIIEGKIVNQVSLHFNDQPNGDITILNADINEVIHRLSTGEGGFMRSVMRGLARERMARGTGPSVPFLLTARDTGLISLIDPVTDRVIALSAFGPDNVKAFVQLFPSENIPLDQ